MDNISSEKQQQKRKTKLKLFVQITCPLILLTLISLQLTRTISFKNSSTLLNNNNNHNAHDDDGPVHGPVPSSRSPKCDLFTGEWVPNPNAPYYTNVSCWAIHEHQNCMKYGRPDTEFMKWSWKPDGCDLPVFNPSQFFEIVRGKSLAFVGDSVARNQMQSLICLLSRVEYPIDVSYAKNEDFKRWHYQTYNFTLASFWTPYLVNAQEDDPHDSVYRVHLDEPDEAWTSQIDDFDYIVVSAGHWFTRPMMYYEKSKLTGCRFCQVPGVKNYTVAYGYQKALETAFRAVAGRESFKGVVYLRTFAPSHFEGGIWNDGGNCLRQKPFKSSEIQLQGLDLDLYLIQLAEFKRAQEMGRKNGLKMRIIDMTQLALLRPDGHPSRYGHWAHENVTLYNDCVHWCLPGPIDTWNDFLLEMMRNEGVISREERMEIQSKQKILES